MNTRKSLSLAVNARCNRFLPLNLPVPSILRSETNDNNYPLIIFSDDMDTNSNLSGLILKINNVDVTGVISFINPRALQFENIVAIGDIVTISYNGFGIKNIFGQQLANISNLAVINNVIGPINLTIVSAATIDNTTLRILFNKQVVDIAGDLIFYVKYNESAPVYTYGFDSVDFFGNELILTYILPLTKYSLLSCTLIDVIDEDGQQFTFNNISITNNLTNAN